MLSKKTYRIALFGNPNVGKSTLFNALTGSLQHTGNWSGKTVDSFFSEFTFDDKKIEIVDLPGTYSLYSDFAEEKIATDYLIDSPPDAVMVICDATVLERNIVLALELSQICKKTCVVLNMMDEADKQGIIIDKNLLEATMNIPVIDCCAHSACDIERIREFLFEYVEKPAPDCIQGFKKNHKELTDFAEKMCALAVTTDDNKNKKAKLHAEKINFLLTNKKTAIPVMLTLLGTVMFITLIGANYPSQWLSTFLTWTELPISSLMQTLSVSPWVISLVVEGAYRTLSWVVAVMLPPMMIFFPMFTLLEDAGILPRIAFNLDKYFKRSGACGKQALTMCMGLGCNAVGVTGCRIIESPREKTIAILTNAFVPCNGRFPTMLTVIALFFVVGLNGILGFFVSSMILVGIIVLGIVATLIASKLISVATSKTGYCSVPFILELPPIRKPRFIKTITTSLFQKTFKVLVRAVVVAFPAGVVIWLLANINCGEASLLSTIANFLDPVARFIGLDGVILLAFVLGFPANEIVLPIALMMYMQQGALSDNLSSTDIYTLLTQNGWTVITAVCVCVFSLLHWPCSTTCITIYKETKSIVKTIVAFLLPTLFGVVLCALIAAIG